MAITQGNCKERTSLGKQKIPRLVLDTEKKKTEEKERRRSRKRKGEGEQKDKKESKKKLNRKGGFSPKIESVSVKVRVVVSKSLIFHVIWREKLVDFCNLSIVSQFITTSLS